MEKWVSIEGLKGQVSGGSDLSGETADVLRSEVGGNSFRGIRNPGLLVWTMGGIVSSKKGIDMIGLWFQKPVLHAGAVKHLQVGCQNTGPRMGLLALSVRLCLQVKPTWCGVVQPLTGPLGTQECGIPPP